MQTLVNFPRRVGLRPLSHQRALLFRPNATRSYSLHPLLQKDREELEKKTPEQPKAPQGKTPPPNPKPSIPFKPKDSSHPKKQPEPLVASTPSETKPSVHPILQRNLAALEKKQKAEKERAAAAAQKTKKPLAVELLAEEEEEEGEDSPERVVLDPEVEARVRAAAAAETAKLRDAALAKIRQAEISAKQATQLVMDEPVDEEEAAAAARAAEQESLREKLSQMTLKSNSKKRGDSDTDLFTTAASLGIAIPDAAGYKSSFEAEGRVVLPDDITLLQAKEQEIREMPTVQSVNKDIQKDKRKVNAPSSLSIQDLATLIGVPTLDITKWLIRLGEAPISLQDLVPRDIANLVANEYETTLLAPPESALPTLQLLMGNPLHDKTPKPPVAVILGHVDHGKTTLLDALRHTSVAKTEAGNITQKISAFQVPVNDRVVTFIDTPGHAAYEAMRSRGAEVTDVAILLVAANEGVQLQTLEAIKHISRTKRPFVVCITKMDITSANSARCYTQLAQAGVLVDKLGGDILCAEVSAKTGEGLDQLLEVVLLQHEATDLKCNPDGLGYGVTLESYLDKAFGPTATILVKNGTFRPGDYLVAGLLQGKTKQLISTSTRKPMTSAPPGTPVNLVGVKGLPDPGSLVFATRTGAEKLMKISRLLTKMQLDLEDKANEMRKRRESFDEAVVKALEELRQKDLSPEEAERLKEIEAELEAQNALLLDAASKVPILPIVLKTDSPGSLESIVNALKAFPDTEIRIVYVRGTIGPITQTDLALAQEFKAEVLGFNVPVQHSEGTDVSPVFDVIYSLLDHLKLKAEERMPPVFDLEVKATARIKQVFEINIKRKVFKPVAGCEVLKGTVEQGSMIRVKRGEEVIFTGKKGSSIDSLRVFKDTVKEVRQGMDCGIGLKEFQEFQAGDLIETFVLHQKRATLNVGRV